MTTYRNFITAVREQTGAENPHVRRGWYSDPNSKFDYNLINNNSTVCHNEIISDTEIQMTVSTNLFNKQLVKCLDRTRRIYISNQMHTFTEMVESRVRGKTPYSYITRMVPKTKSNPNGVRYAGEFQLTDYNINSDNTVTEIWTKI